MSALIPAVELRKASSEQPLRCALDMNTSSVLPAEQLHFFRSCDLTWLFWTKLCEKLSEDKELWSCRRRGSMRSRSWCCAAAPD